MAKISDIQPTPNPNSMRFVLKENLTNGESYSYDFGEHENEQINDIFKYDGVDNIFVMKNFVTITQDGSREWAELLREVAVPIREMGEDVKVESKQIVQKEINDVRFTDIKNILDENVAPYLEGDGGGLSIDRIENDTVYINYVGACGSCSMGSTGTLYAIESLVKRHYPEMSVDVINSPFF